MADGEGGPDWGRDYDLLAVFARRLVPPSLRHRFRESDLVQDTLMIAHKKRDELAHLDPTARGRVLVGILRNVARDRVRAAHRHQRDARREERQCRFTEEVGVGIERALTDPGPDPASEAARLEQLRAVAAAVAGLRDDQREAFELHFFDGLSHAQVAARTGLTDGQVKHALRAAVAAVRAAVPDGAGGAP